MKKTLLVGLLALFAFAVQAQTSDETKKLINKIKRSPSYISAEATLPDEAEAIQLAKEILVSQINEWLAEKRGGEEVKHIVLQDISACTERMDMKRGTNTRAFVYVKKKDIVLIQGEGQIVLSDSEKGTDLQPLSEVSEPIKVSAEPTSTVEVIHSAKDNLALILEAKTMSDIKTVFAKLKADKAITYGVYPSEQPEQDCYLLFYDRGGAVKGVVHKTADTITDARQEQPVELSTYSGCGAYWFILSNQK